MALDDCEEWSLCTDWLETCGMLTEDQNISIRSVEHLASILKDGVILCNLCNRLKPDCISPRSFSQRPQGSPFLCNKNIKAFLVHCKSSFRIKDSHLFDPPDLLEFRDFGKVIYTLSRLSQTKEAKSDIKPFYVIEGTDYVIMDKIMDDVEDEYNSSLYGTSLDVLGNDDNSEDIYKYLVIKKDDTAAFQPRSKKESCMHELVSTEMNFINVLNTIIKVFIKELKDCLTSEENAIIFFMIEDLKKIHTDLYNKLHAALLSPNPSVEIANCFIGNHLSLVLYGEFCSKIEAATQELMRVCRENPVACDIVKKGTEIAHVKLHDLLTVPVQRILKYHLIIKELIKHCHDNPEEVKPLKTALDAVEDLGLYINEVKRDYENISTIAEIQKSIVNIQKFFPGGSPITLEDYGRRHFDGEFRVKRLFGSQYKARYLFLFDKLLIICKILKGGDQYSYEGALAMRCLEIHSCGSDKGLSHLILSDMENTNEKYFVSAKKPENIMKLLSYLDIAKSNCCPEGRNTAGHIFILTSFNEALCCSVCNKLLRGKISQGYKCKFTNKVVHKECLLKAVNQFFVKRPSIVTLKPPLKPPLDDPCPQRPIHLVDMKIRKSGCRSIPNSPDPRDHPWFAKANGRNDASNILRNLPDGTFLVRWSGEQESYVISMKFDTVRHLRIYQTDSGDYYLKSSKTFKMIPLLIDHYKNNSLQEIYSSIATVLKQPYTEVTPIKPTKCKALYDFSVTEAGQLNLFAGDIIEIMSKKDGGWWKGRLNGKKGNFPSNYVEEICD